MNILLVRHGLTKGNLEKRYVGSTDESILPDELVRLKQQHEQLINNTELNCFLSDIKKIYVSSMKRTKETANVLFPDYSTVAIEEFNECNFGEFEYKNYKELSFYSEYQRYIDTYGESAFPHGESKKDFTDRVINGFKNITENEDGNICIVAHGGTLKAILSEVVIPHKDYFDWEINNGCGYMLCNNGENYYTVCGIYP